MWEKEPSMADTNTVIGQSILVKGNLQGDEDLTVQGRIEGSVQLTKTLIIEPSGVVKADVSVCNAVISGVMVGNLTATDSVEISETGRMVGDIQAPRMIITEGALFKGQVDMGDVKTPREPTERRSQPVRASVGRMEPVRKTAFVPSKSTGSGASSSKAVSPPSSTKAESKVESKPEKKTAPEEPVTVSASKKKVVVKKRR